MIKRGFTLIEVIIGLSILGLITVTVLPIVNSSFGRFKIQETKAEMIYICESVIEKIKAYEIQGSSDMFIYDMSLSEIIDLFKELESVEITLPMDSSISDYEVNIMKKQRSNKLWVISVFVNERGEGKNNRKISFEALVPEK